ncbi:hypothetical protein QCA50_003938 [Cerrena zonata]|uniref:Microbial-type PARG catalytic domain-containing protein n=1 Tax=Cerrena zonata TaxID=2478898 RepID=A0AAW0GQ06_9APHY
MATTKETQEDPRRKALRQIAEETLETIKAGSYLDCDLIAAVTTSKQNTRFYAPDSLFSTWASSKSDASSSKATQISLLEVSTLEGARLIANSYASSDSCPRIGVLNFASAKKPGGGFLSGAQAQEESIARSSTLYPTLMTRVAQSFYTLHNKDPKNGYYSHAMIYSPGVIVLRDDQGGWVEPLKIDVLTCAAVNAGVVRQGISIITKVEKEKKIRKTMKERMARILFLFEQQGIKNIVLGSFGTGVFRNDVEIVAKLWGELLLVDKARFKRSFEHIVFAVLGRDTFETFEQIFAQY